MNEPIDDPVDPLDDAMIEDEIGPYCDICDIPMDWEPCNTCDGDGFLDWETLQFEDPLWYQPSDTEQCSECQGKGGWWQCPNVPHIEKGQEL